MIILNDYPDTPRRSQKRQEQKPKQKQNKKMRLTKKKTIREVPVRDYSQELCVFRSDRGGCRGGGEGWFV